MTALPPHPERWTVATIALSPSGDDRWAGEMRIDGVLWYVRDWHKADGVVRFEAQPAADAEFIALVERLGAGAEGV